ncbi:hypothetical protein ACHQM5_009848 [Ranunculus cassubicifolius]
MAVFNRASPALKEILLKLYSAEKPLEMDHQLHEFGSVQYCIQASASSPHQAYLSVSSSLNSLTNSTLQTLKRTYSNVIEILDSPNQGYQLTLLIKFSQLPHSKDECLKIITEISSVQAVILSSQIKEILWNLGSEDPAHGMHKPVRLVYHPGDPFFVIRMREKVTVIFPMHFRENSDVIIAKSLFQELVEVGFSRKFAKAPPCTWSAVPPPELRGQLFDDLSTNGGFVSFDIYSRHIEGSKLDKTVWNLLNFHAFVRYHVKCTRGFIQRRMRKKVEDLSGALRKAILSEEKLVKNKLQGRMFMKKIIRVSKSKMLRGKWATLVRKIKKLRSRVRIQVLSRFHRKWFKLPKFYSLRRYAKLID